MKTIMDLEVFGQLPDMTTVSIFFTGIPEEEEEDYLEKGRQALLEWHCEDIDSTSHS